MLRKKRVRIHLIDPNPHTSLPSVEGLLVARWGDEFVVAVPRLLVAAGARPAELEDARELRIPKRNVAFYEVLR